MILADTRIPSTEDLPTYSPMPYTPFRRVTGDSTASEPIDARTLRSRESRQRELRELQRQWNIRRRTHPTASSELARTERTRYRPLVSEAFDLPPPYAHLDPYPLFKPADRRPSLVSRVLLYPFVPEGELLDQAAFRTDRWAAKVRSEVAMGVKEVGKKARAVPGKIEDKRAKRKIRWLEERGLLEVQRERERRRETEAVGEHVRCSAYAGAWQVM